MFHVTSIINNKKVSGALTASLSASRCSALSFRLMSSCRPLNQWLKFGERKNRLYRPTWRHKAALDIQQAGLKTQPLLFEIGVQIQAPSSHAHYGLSVSSIFPQMCFTPSERSFGIHLKPSTQRQPLISGVHRSYWGQGIAWDKIDFSSGLY